MTEEIVKEYDSEKQRQENLAKRIAKYREGVVNEAKEQVRRWSKTGMLEGIEGDYEKEQMALLLENQRLMNEISTDSGDMAQFKRISIPLVRRIFDPKACLVWDLASLQVMTGPTGFAFFNRPDGEIVEEVSAKTKRIKSLWEIPVQDIRENYDLDKEAEMTAVMAYEICDEINEEVISDLRNNVGIHEEIEWQGAEALWSFLTGLFYRFETEIGPNREVPFGKKPNWIITGESLAKELKGCIDYEPVDYLTLHHSVGFLGKDIKLIEHPQLLPNDILIGYKEGGCGSGYVYMPYVPLTRTPIMLDPETFEPKAGILTRYTKRISNKGSHFYARLTVKGHEDIGEKAEKSE